MSDLTLYVVPHSTNVQRVELALGHKGLTATQVEDDFFGDRPNLTRVSGQPYAPALAHGSTVVHDSTRIIGYLENTFPDTPRLWPADARARAEADIFVDWFNRTWKREPNLIDAELAKPEAERDDEGIARWERRMAQRRDWFEALLDGRPYLLGDSFGIADVIAWPFLRFAAGLDEGDPHEFHAICFRTQDVTGGGFPNLSAWIDRVGGHPRA